MPWLSKKIANGIIHEKFKTLLSIKKQQLKLQQNISN